MMQKQTELKGWIVLVAWIASWIAWPLVCWSERAVRRRRAMRRSELAMMTLRPVVRLRCARVVNVMAVEKGVPQQLRDASHAPSASGQTHSTIRWPWYPLVRVVVVSNGNHECEPRSFARR